MNFNKTIKKIVGPVFNLFEFTLKEESSIIEYDHELMSIIISYDFSRSFEIDVKFLFNSNNEFYSIAELKEYLSKERNQFIATQIFEEDKLKKWAKALKIFLQDYLDILIKNHTKICFELDIIRKQKLFDYNNERNERFFKDDIDKLWKDKKYAELIKLIENYKGGIDGTLKKKYEYAIKKVG